MEIVLDPLITAGPDVHMYGVGGVLVCTRVCVLLSSTGIVNNNGIVQTYIAFLRVESLAPAPIHSSYNTCWLAD